MTLHDFDEFDLENLAIALFIFIIVIFIIAITYFQKLDNKYVHCKELSNSCIKQWNFWEYKTVYGSDNKSINLSKDNFCGLEMKACLDN